MKKKKKEEEEEERRSPFFLLIFLLMSLPGMGWDPNPTPIIPLYYTTLFPSSRLRTLTRIKSLSLPNIFPPSQTQGGRDIRKYGMGGKKGKEKPSQKKKKNWIAEGYLVWFTNPKSALSYKGFLIIWIHNWGDKCRVCPPKVLQKELLNYLLLLLTTTTPYWHDWHDIRFDPPLNI